MVLSQFRLQGAASAGSNETVEAIVADAWENAALVRGEVHSAEEDVGEVDVEAADNADERK